MTPTKLIATIRVKGGKLDGKKVEVRVDCVREAELHHSASAPTKETDK